MKPPLWRLFAVTIGALLLVATALDCYSTGPGNTTFPFTWTADQTVPGTMVVTSVRDRSAIRGAVHAGDRVGLEDRSLANRLDWARGRLGAEFAFAGTTAGGARTRFVATVRAAPPVAIGFWIYELMRVAFVLVALVVAVRRPGDPAARRLVFFFLALAAIMESPQPWMPIWLAGLVQIAVTPLGKSLAVYAGLEIATTFPFESARGIRPFLRRWNPWLFAITAATQLSITALDVVLDRSVPSSLTVLGAAEPLALFAAIVLALTIAIREATGADKQRARWIAFSLCVGLVGPAVSVILDATGARIDALQYVVLTLLAIPLGMGYAIVRHRVIDIGFVVNRALVFGAISAIVVLAFVTLEWLLGSMVVRFSHVTSATVELGLAIVLGFSLRWIHRKVDAAVDDVFFRARREAERALRTFAREVAYITDPRVAVERTRALLIARAGASGAAVYLVTGTAAERIDPGASATPTRLDIDDPALVRMRATRLPVPLGSVASAFAGDHAFPMCVRDAITGAVVLGAKSNGEAYAPDEIATVETVALALGNALDALQTAALKAEIARVLLDGAPVETLRRTVDAAAWVRGVVSP